MGDPLEWGVREVETILREETSKGKLTLDRYVAIVDKVADEVFCSRKELHEEVRTSLGHAFGIEAVETPGPRR